MNHWIEGETYDMARDPAIFLAPGDKKPKEPRVLAISITADGNITFYELCDQWFSFTVPPADAVEALEEAIAWIRAQK